MESGDRSVRRGCQIIDHRADFEEGPRKSVYEKQWNSIGSVGLMVYEMDGNWLGIVELRNVHCRGILRQAE
jgi:hypothetical protein